MCVTEDVLEPSGWRPAMGVSSTPENAVGAWVVRFSEWSPGRMMVLENRTMRALAVTDLRLHDDRRYHFKRLLPIAGAVGLLGTHKTSGS